MIFNSAIPSQGGGGTSGWTDISSSFDADSAGYNIYAYTNGEMVFLTYVDEAGGATAIYVLTSAYNPIVDAFGAGVDTSGRPCTLQIDSEGNGTYYSTDSDPIMYASITYPIAPTQ